MTTVLDDKEAALTSENAELRRRLTECEAEVAEARAREAAIAEVLQVINASPGDLAPVFEAILEKVHSLCGVEFGVLHLYEDEKFHAVAARGYPKKFEQLVRRPYSLEPNSPLHALLHGEALVEIPDVIAHQAVAPNPRAEAAIAVGLRCALFLPLRRDSQLLGMITAARKEARPFSDKEIGLLQNFAAQAEIAMENARLLTETREALEQQTATAEVLQVINSSPGDLAPVFDAMLDKAMRLCEEAFGAFFIREGERLRAVATRGLSERLNDFLRQGFEVDWSRPLWRGAAIEHIADLTKEDLTKRPGPRAALELGGARTLLNFILRRDDVLFGVFSIFRQEVRPFTDKQIALLENFAAQAVIAMENARLLGELRARTDEIAAMNRDLEACVVAQLGELERVGRLKRFLAPQLAEMIVARGEEKILESHRRDIVVVFCDLRGFTAFAETAEPEEVLDLLRDYHAALGPLVTRSEGTLDHFSGDGIMVLFNDPLPCADAPERAVGMALQMREAVAGLQRQWRRRGRRIGFGVGIAQGYATLGEIGFAERVDYTAIGTVCNLAARLCAEAQDGQILISGRIAAAIEDSVRLEEIGDLALKGLTQAVAVYNIAGAER